MTTMIDTMAADAAELFDVIAVNMATHKMEIMAEKKTKRNADAIEMMAVMRRGVETHFYTSEPAGKYNPGDEWNPVEEL